MQNGRKKLKVTRGNLINCLSAIMSLMENAKGSQAKRERRNKLMADIKMQVCRTSAAETKSMLV
jgi:hypothetical protein